MDPGLVACISAGQTVSVGDYQATRERKYAYCAARSAGSSRIGTS